MPERRFCLICHQEIQFGEKYIHHPVYRTTYCKPCYMNPTNWARILAAANGGTAQASGIQSSY